MPRRARPGCPLLTARFPRGTGVCRYRCFLPDLTGFAGPPCTGPNYQQSTSWSYHPTIVSLTLAQPKGSAQPKSKLWRRGRDSNPRYGVNRTHDFQSCTFNRSVTSPSRSPRPRIADDCLEINIAALTLLQSSAS